MSKAWIIFKTPSINTSILLLRIVLSILINFKARDIIEEKEKNINVYRV